MNDEGIVYIDVQSSNVAAVGYDTAFSRLWVKFDSGAVYKYERVPSYVYLDFLRAPSKGVFLWEVIRGNGTDSVYAYTRVR